MSAKGCNECMQELPVSSLYESYYDAAADYRKCQRGHTGQRPTRDLPVPRGPISSSEWFAPGVCTVWVRVSTSSAYMQTAMMSNLVTYPGYYPAPLQQPYTSML